MEVTNNTAVHYFLLLAFSELHEFQVLLFIIFFIVYIICIVGNVAIIVIIKTDPYLHNPMYFFISIFATSEILFVFSIAPNLLSNLMGYMKSISFTGCFAQLCALGTLGLTECCLLAVMAFDRDLAINYPLRYSSIMRDEFCILLGVLPWFICLTIDLLITILFAGLEFCGSLELNHFMCDWGVLQLLPCIVPLDLQCIVIITNFSGIVLPFVTIVLLYIHIITTIVKMKSETGKRKAFSTCSSHLIVASLFFGTAIIVYFTPEISNLKKYLALMYTFVTPLLNPFIYTLKNKDVITAFKKL
ncbi:hypothetical protein GDO86_019422 [Hymenochirus boettgeri]|uniref:G-protein coupled receptors family 1 profile domain-containing protein n=1 Tax=Hymenochirus boettgeri TaxID=247094 RepID=A0A8T2IEX4_9PIPI|nr:hypothetical protein GDO86_019422 [Hymenochirus boettgeri]